jgi:hypothetical protein
MLESTVSIKDFFRGRSAAKKEKQRLGERLAEPIERWLRQGLLTLDEITFRAMLAFEPDEDDRSAAAMEARRPAIAALVAETWRRLARTPPKRPTPLDRLQSAYDQLDRVGILCRHYPDGGRADALSWIDTELRIAAGQGRAYRGYCFHDQFTNDMDEGRLGFCFGPARRPRSFAELWQAMTDVAGEVSKALAAQGMHSEWRGPRWSLEVPGIDWQGARDAAGAPVIKTGLLLDGEYGPSDGADEPAASLPVYVDALAPSPDAHALIAAVARHAARPMFGEVSRFADLPAAVTVAPPSGPSLELLTAESIGQGAGILHARELVRACPLLVAMAPSLSSLKSVWWLDYPPERRVLVVPAVAEATHEGSSVHAVDVHDGHGVAELVARLGELASRLSPPA